MIRQAGGLFTSGFQPSGNDSGRNDLYPSWLARASTFLTGLDATSQPRGSHRLHPHRSDRGTKATPAEPPLAFNCTLWLDHPSHSHSLALTPLQLSPATVTCQPLRVPLSPFNFQGPQLGLTQGGPLATKTYDHHYHLCHYHPQEIRTPRRHPHFP